MVSQSLHFILGFLCGGFIILVGGLRVGDRVGCGYCITSVSFFRPSSPVILFILGLIFFTSITTSPRRYYIPFPFYLHTSYFHLASPHPPSSVRYNNIRT